MINDLRYGFRMLLHSPGFSAVAVITLAFGVGVNTSVFTVLYSVAMRPLPVRDPELIVKIYQHFTGEFSREIHGSPYMLSYHEYLNYRAKVSVFSGLIAYNDVGMTLNGATNDKVSGLLVSDNYFAVLGAELALGRFFQSGECQIPGGCPLAVLSHGCWQRLFGNDPTIVGKTVTLNRQRFTVIGIASPRFRGTEVRVPDVWIPLMMQAQVMPGRDYFPLRNSGWLDVVGRLKPGVSINAAQAEMTVVASQADSEYPGRKTILTIMPGALLSGPEVSNKGFPVAIVIMVVVGLVLLIACANITNLLLTRASARQQEIGVRLALGASPRRVMQQLLTETMVLAVFGGIAGLLVAYWLPPILLMVVPESELDFDLTPNLTVFGYCLCISALAGLGFGLAPAREATKLNLNAMLKSEPSQLGRRVSQSRLRNILVVVQIAVCLVLLIGAALLLRGLQRAQSIDLGFNAKNLLVLSPDLADSGYEDPRAIIYFRQLCDRLRVLPGVKSVSLTGTVPFAGESSTPMTLEDREAAKGEGTTVNFNSVSPEFFSTLGIPLLQGRNFNEAEAREGSHVAIVSEGMARHFWPGADPIGKRFKYRDSLHEVVGVARNVNTANIAEAAAPIFYLPAQTGNILVRTDPRSPSLMAAARQAAVSLDRNIFVSVTRTEDSLDQLVHPLRSGLMFSGVLGLLALVLAGVGIYGVQAFSVSQRTKEIGIRSRCSGNAWRRTLASCRHRWRMAVIVRRRSGAPGSRSWAVRTSALWGYRRYETEWCRRQCVM